MLTVLALVFLTFSLSFKANGVSIDPSGVLPITNAKINPDGHILLSLLVPTLSLLNYA